MIVNSNNGEKEPTKEKESEDSMGALEQLLGGPQKEIRTIGLIGDVDEENEGSQN